jgi:alkylation response protein AidB-like acyl-CoA dehydrogenase
MHFELSEEQTLVQQTARDFATKRLLPNAAKRDLDGTFPADELRELADMGLLGINVPESLGGAEAGVIAYSLVMQEIARADPSVAVEVSVTNMVAELIATYGTDEQRKAHVPKLVGGDHLCGAFALSEPDAGSDPSAMRTTATKIDGGWRLDGTKQWITGGDKAGLMVVWAVTDPEAGAGGISAFIVEGGARGLVVNRAEEKMGLHGSTTVQLGFDNLEVADDALLGDQGAGFKLAMAALDGGRIGISSQAIGCASFALEQAVRYGLERKAFDKPIIKHQAIGFSLADCATWLEAAKLMTLRAAFLKESGAQFSKQAAMAKLFSTEHAVNICDAAIQVHGGYGYTRDFPVERAYRDVRVTKIYEGTSEIQKIVIGRALIKEFGA